MMGSVLMIGLEQSAIMIALCGLIGDEIRSKFKYKVLLIVAVLIILLVYTKYNLMGSWMIIPNVIMILGVKDIFQRNWTESILSYLMAFVVVGSFELFFYIPFAIVKGGMFDDRIAGILGTSGTVLILVLMVRFKIFDLNIIFSALFKKNIMMCFTIVSYSVIMMIASMYFREYETISYYGYFFVLALLVLLVPILVQYVKAQCELEEQRKYQKPMMDVIDRIRQQQHQYDNHLNAIYGMIRAYPTYGELVEHLEGYMKSVGKADMSYQLLFINDPVLSGFLSVKFADARERGILVENLIEIKQVNTNILIFELVGVLGNLLDNAFEETEKFPGENRIVKLYVGENDDNYIFRITNPSREMKVSDMRSVFKKGYTTKTGSDKRGYGLYNVMKTINKHKGSISAKNYAGEDGEYWFEIQMQIKRLGS